MNSKRTIAECRNMKLEMWIARQPLNGKLNSTIEAAHAFRAKLAGWVANPDPGAVAPTFHHAPQAKI